jgi:hypothetical protein
LDDLDAILNGTDRFIKALGGLPGLLATIGTIATKVFHNQMAQGLTNAAYNIKTMFPNGKAKAQ